MPKYLPKVVSFDCAQTLLEVDWSVSRYIADLCMHLGLEIPLHGPARYEEIYHQRLRSYIHVNMTRDHAKCDAWWLELGQDWLIEMELPPDRARDLQLASEQLGFGPQSILFRLYEDVVPCLAELKNLGIRTAVLSNWDYSLHKTLRGFGLSDHFELIVASLEHGVEKPDPALFQVLVDHFQVSRDEIMHVGDNPEDDLAGARGAGMRGVLLDRSLNRSEEPVLHTLSNLAEAFDWSG